jgi:hypothetical protein
MFIFNILRAALSNSVHSGYEELSAENKDKLKKMYIQPARGDYSHI